MVLKHSGIFIFALRELSAENVDSTVLCSSKFTLFGENKLENERSPCHDARSTWQEITNSKIAMLMLLTLNTSKSYWVYVYFV